MKALESCSIVFSDNTGTVGETCIHGRFNSQEMQILKDAYPNGSFVPTFLPDNDFRSKFKTSEWFPERLAEYHGGRPKFIQQMRPRYGFYFHFKLDSLGIALLRNLGFVPEKARFWSERHGK